MSKPRAISTVVPKLTRKVFGQKSTLLARLILNWSDIVGKTLAGQVMPAELHYRSFQINGQQAKKLIVSLYVRDGATALELQYQTQQIMEKMNVFLGYNGVHDLRFIQAPEMFRNTGRRMRLKLKEVSMEEHDKIKQCIKQAEIPETELEVALQSLGESILLANKVDDKVDK